METETYDISAGTSWHGQEVVGEFAYEAAIRQLSDYLRAPDREERFFTAELVPEPDNPHSVQGHAISVRWRNKVIGYLPEADAARYQQIRRIVASGLTATCSGRLWYFTDEEGGRHYYLSLSLADPANLFPLNNPPYEEWTLLPRGGTTQVTKESDHLDVLLDHVPPSGEGPLLVTLHIVPGGTRVLYDAIEVRLDDERIGELTKQSSAKFVDAVRHYDDLGLTTVARAKIRGSSLAAEVTLHAAKSHELSDADLDPVTSPLPRLEDYSEDPMDYFVPAAYIAPEEPAAQGRKAGKHARLYDSTSPEPLVSQPYRQEQSLGATPPQSPPLFTGGKLNKQAAFEAAMKVPNKGKILLWLGVVFAGLSLVAGAGTIGTDPKSALGIVLFGAGIGLACGWALYCRSEDKKALERWKSDQAANARMAQSLAATDPLIADGLVMEEPPQPKPRHWMIVGIASALLIMVGIALAPATSTTTGTPTSTHSSP
ncbi:hypothetical protein PQG76_07920 [Corynebacterium falsenii]|uniref:hypothetical protein n=1 Tax=Corynebacterium falsenii TaxID=108486 RepID=UPI00234C7288|nr:hypothetical protein [Corynebacterium falsenii]MDC7104432.1 hypothetical protein [Corynebacterium falsenii]